MTRRGREHGLRARLYRKPQRSTKTSRHNFQWRNIISEYIIFLPLVATKLISCFERTDNASAAHPAQTSVQTIPDNNQQPQHYNYTPLSKYTPSIAHALVDDTQQTANYTHSAPLNEVQLEDMLLSDFAIPQWRDM